MKIVRKKLFFLSSADRQATESGNQFSIVFPENLMRIQPNEQLRITMTYFSLLNSFQNINANDNTVGVSLVRSGTVYHTFLVLPVGSFSVSVIALNFTTALNTWVNTTLGFSDLSFSLTVASTSTYYSNMKQTGSGALTSLTLYFQSSALPKTIFTQQEIALNPLMNGMARILGFAHTTTSYTYSASAILSPNSVNSPFNMFSGQIPYLRLHCDVPPQNIEYDTSLGNNQMNFSDILAQISILVSPFAPIVYQDFAGDTNCFEMPAKGMRVGTINFTLTDNYNTPVILNDDFDFVLKIEVMVDEGNDTKHILQDLLNTSKLQTLNMESYFGKI
jgi:hypothetical protein